MARGSLTHSPGNGRKIAVFPYDIEQEVDGKVVFRKIEIEVYMQSRYKEDSPPPKMVTATQFYLTCEGETETGTDLDTCLKAIRGKLDEKFRINWERWLLVRIEPEMIISGTGAGLRLSWTDIERGETLDGDVLMREYNTYGDFNNRWKVSPWPDVYRDKKGKTVATVPATPENEAALEAFAGKIRKLRKTLSLFVAPESIEETLRMITDGNLRLLGSDGDHGEAGN